MIVNAVGSDALARIALTASGATNLPVFLDIATTPLNVPRSSFGTAIET